MSSVCEGAMASHYLSPKRGTHSSQCLCTFWWRQPRCLPGCVSQAMPFSFFPGCGITCLRQSGLATDTPGWAERSYPSVPGPWALSHNNKQLVITVAVLGAKIILANIRIGRNLLNDWLIPLQGSFLYHLFPKLNKLQDFLAAVPPQNHAHSRHWIFELLLHYSGQPEVQECSPTLVIRHTEGFWEQLCMSSGIL